MNVIIDTIVQIPVVKSMADRLGQCTLFASVLPEYNASMYSCVECQNICFTSTPHVLIFVVYTLLQGIYVVFKSDSLM